MGLNRSGSVALGQAVLHGRLEVLASLQMCARACVSSPSIGRTLGAVSWTLGMRVLGSTCTPDSDLGCV